MHVSILIAYAIGRSPPPQDRWQRGWRAPAPAAAVRTFANPLQLQRL